MTHKYYTHKLGLIHRYIALLLCPIPGLLVLKVSERNVDVLFVHLALLMTFKCFFVHSLSGNRSYPRVGPRFLSRLKYGGGNHERLKPIYFSDFPTLLQAPPSG